MKIGFITTHQYRNFGTFLQCYALQYVLESLGHEVEIIDYRRKEYQRGKIERLRIWLGNIRRYPVKNLRKVQNCIRTIKRNRLFQIFYFQYFHLSSESYATFDELKSHPPVYDLYIAGSDQIWNPSLNGFIKAYFLTFVPEGKKTSYAPSIGITSLNEVQKRQFAILLSDYQHISCREKTGVQLLNECGIKNVVQVVDPTLLLPSSFWQSLAKKSSLSSKDNYGLAYFLSCDEEKEHIVAPLYHMLKRFDLTMDNTCNSQSILAAGPCEFLSLIRNADFVCTDSFHGVVFSVIFQKEFYALPRHRLDSANSQNSRIIDFLNDLGLEERWITQPLLSRIPIHYTDANIKLQNRIKHSFDYLNRMLYD